jgi:hemerythrin-like domain-containing protein
MMGIVHDAFRRDFTRARRVLSSQFAPPRRQREAIGRHVEWMVNFLHQHHHGEDRGLWPLVRDRAPRAAALLDELEADHRRIAPLLDGCSHAASGYAASPRDDRRLALVDALRRLTDELLPHLSREEDEAMPTVSVSVSAAEWHAIDQQYYVQPKSLAQLGFEGHWLLDGLDAERSQVVVHQVPPIPRLVLVHGFTRRYRRHASACWGDAGQGAYGPDRPLPRRIPRQGRVETVVSAPCDAVWSVVSDVTRVPQWSRECREVDWLDGATAAAPGVRFRGTNRAGRMTWSRVNEVVACEEPHRLVWRTVPTRRFPDSSRWTVELEPVDGGTRIAQSYEVLRAPAILAVVYAVLVRTHRGRDSELVDDLHRLGALAAGERVDTLSSSTASGTASASVGGSTSPSGGRSRRAVDADEV